MPTARTLRLNELLQRELSALLHQEHQTEAVAITVTSVDVSPDLKACRIFVAVTGDGTLVEDRLRWLRRQAAALRTTLSRRIVLKHLPALTFVPDTATSRGNRILAVLDEIVAREKLSPVPSGGESDSGGDISPRLDAPSGSGPAPVSLLELASPPGQAPPRAKFRPPVEPRRETAAFPVKSKLKAHHSKLKAARAQRSVPIP